MKTLERLRQDVLLATEINKLEARLWRQVRRENIQTVLITSAARGEGKSTTVAFLATSLGLYPGRKILAMDFDFRVPTLNRYFEAKISRGIGQVIAKEASLRDAVIATELPSLDLAFPRPEGADPDLLLRTQELLGMMASLREVYDLILIDAPAIIPVPDATMLMPLADGVILTGMAGKTTEPQLRRARQICEGMGANILGLVVGNIQEAAPEYLADDYDYYGYAENGRPGNSNQRPKARKRAT